MDIKVPAVSPSVCSATTSRDSDGMRLADEMSVSYSLELADEGGLGEGVDILATKLSNGCRAGSTLSGNGVRL